MSAQENLTSTAPPPADRARQRRSYFLQGLVVLLVLIVAVFVARSLLQSSPMAGSRPVPERQARLVDVVSLEATDYQPTITGWGTLRPSRDLTVRAQVSGAVETLSPRLEPGMTVSRGDQLVKLETAPYQAALVEAQSALAEAEANLALEQGQQAIAKREFELISERAGDPDASASLALREPQLSIAQAVVDAAQARLTRARLDLERATLEAPFEALVTSRGVTVGAQVTTSTDIARLVGIDTWWVEVLLSAEKLAWLDSGRGESRPAPVTLRQPGVWGPDQSREGVLLRVLQELEDQGNLARVLVAVDDPLGEGIAPGRQELPSLLLGSFLRADIPGRRLDGVFVLEPRWLRENSRVWLMDPEGMLEIRPVEVLYRDEEAVVVSAGLSPGEKLITSRLSTPAEGMPLRTESRTDAVRSGNGSDASTSTADTDHPAPEADHG